MNAKGRKTSAEGEEKDPFAEHAIAAKCVGATIGEAGNERGGVCRHRVRIISRRVRLCDPDNLVGGVKHLVDALRIARIIPEDDPASLLLEVSQEKVKTFAAEETLVEVTVP
jgi:hypothetical protein